MRAFQEQLKTIIIFIHNNSEIFMAHVVCVPDYDDLISVYMSGYTSVVEYLDSNLQIERIGVDTIDILDWYEEMMETRKLSLRNISCTHVWNFEYDCTDRHELDVTNELVSPKYSCKDCF